MSEKHGGKTQLSPGTPEFGALEYSLQLALRASTTRIVSAHALSNPHLTLQFEKRCNDTLILPSWLDATQLAGSNTEEDVIRRGFEFPPSQHGMKFVVGGLEAGRRKGEGRGLRKALLCRVGVGRAYVADEVTAENTKVPDGYDSFYVKGPGDDAAKDPKNVNDQYHHEYFVRETAQILPVYLVHYDFDYSKENKSREKAKCDNCEEEHATVFCTADAANLCGKCDAQLHVSKLASRHVRTPIGKGADVFGSCRHHPDKLIEFFCSQCHIPVCVFCKMVGNHANGEAARHQLVSVAEAYTSVIQEAQTHDPILQARRTEITSQIAAVNSRAKAVEKMGAQIEAQIEDMYKRAMADLKHVVKNKLTVLLGDELELHRQFGEIERLEEFLRYQQEGDATTFLFNWAKHQQCRSELHDFRFFRNQIDVQLDARITGGITVSIDRDRAAVVANGGPNGAGTGGAGGGGVGGGGKKLGHGHGHGHGSKAATLSGPVTSPKASGFGMGMPTQTLKPERRVHRRISDFFAETLGTFDQMSAPRAATAHGHRHDHSDDEGSSIMSSAAETY
ncbi:hypothetical protein HKX48_007306 [Thoreauomyces humboldtii]|nr:hypothetical protein HKX48_007306 [Thoreauomyces humboldtii]